MRAKYSGKGGHNYGSFQNDSGEEMSDEDHIQ